MSGSIALKNLTEKEFKAVAKTDKIEGMRIFGDEWANGENGSVELLTCDDWDKAEFRYNHLDMSFPALNVEITGRVAYYGRAYSPYRVRVQITSPGDGEPDTVFGGWLLFYEAHLRSL